MFRITTGALALTLVIGTAACSSHDAFDGSQSVHSPESVGSAFSIGGETADEKSFTLFESGQVRPLALSLDGKHLYATNTPDNRLEIFQISGSGLTKVGSVSVGLEPIAVAARNDSEVWVVNHLSDSVSIIDVRSPSKAYVKRTLLVGDEPRDIVFAGCDRSRAFITTAHRGQNTGRDPQITTPGVGRADVWIFETHNLGAALTGTPLKVVTLYTDTPRALAVSPDLGTVYVAGFQTGNRTTTVNERLVTNRPPNDTPIPLPDGGTTLPPPMANLPPPRTNFQGIPAPPVSLVVQYRAPKSDPSGAPHWFDELDRSWDAQVNFNLPDKDVFAIDADFVNDPNDPNQDIGKGVYTGVGTVIFNMAVNPRSGKVYVANTDALNGVRFEGHNAFGGTGSVRGHLVDSRITVLDASTVMPRFLNKHIDYAQQGTADERAKALAFPMGMAVSRNGGTLYVAALGSSKVGVFRTAELEADTFYPNENSQIAVSGGGPTGVVLDESRDRLYVLTRFDNAISIVSTRHNREVGHVRMYNPEPPSITKGRRFLYDARATSSHGDSACASCHIFGDFDSLAWDLGDPDNTLLAMPRDYDPNNPLSPESQAREAVTFSVSAAVIQSLGGPAPIFLPMKGPMTTQSLRGMANHGPMHWRGDRNGGLDEPSAQPNSGIFNEDIAFKKFNVAFPGLLGNDAELSAEDLQAFTDFILQVTYPPNPIRSLDNQLTPFELAGKAFFNAQLPNGQEIPSDVFHNCSTCHVVDPDGNRAAGVAKPGFFGTDGRFSFESETQYLKVPHLRNLYQKVGMFGMVDTFPGLAPLPNPASPVPLLAFLPAPLNDTSHQGDQVRGFGFLHDGSVDTVFRFHGANLFTQRPLGTPFPNPGGITLDAAGVLLRRQIEAFMMAMDSNLAPIVGQQVTLTVDNADDLAVGARIELLQARAAAGECDLVVRGRREVTSRGRARGLDVGYLYQPGTGLYRMSIAAAAPLTESELRPGGGGGGVNAITYTAVPPGSGIRIALDRDLDGSFDGDEILAGKDPANASSR
jgi:DNA-binding beta-propeller fold protein YncE